MRWPSRQNLKPFAVFHHNVAIGGAFTEELGARGVICLCTTSNARSLYTDFAPHAYTILPVLEEYYANIAEYVGKRLNGKPAKYAGAAPLGRGGFNDERKFGLVFLEGTGADVNPADQAGGRVLQEGAGEVRGQARERRSATSSTSPRTSSRPPTSSASW